MTRWKEAIISCFQPFFVFFCFTIKNSSEIEKMPPENSSEIEKMPPDILEEISDRLPLRDFVAFRGVCRQWRSAPSGRSDITSFSKEKPWLLFYSFDDANESSGVCYLYNRPHPNCCTIRLPHLRGATIMHSNAGWLFVRSLNGHFFLYNPLTLTKMDLPMHDVAQEQVCTMTAPTLVPKNGCTAFILSRITYSDLEISSCRIGDTEWKSNTAKISEDRIGTLLTACACNCTNGLWCIKGSKGTLVYDYMREICVKEWLETHAKAKSGKFKFWDHDLNFPIHQKNWLDRFGQKGIKISVCGLSKKGDGSSIGISQGCRVIAGESGSTEEHKLVRASWIDPRFD